MDNKDIRSYKSAADEAESNPLPPKKMLNHYETIPTTPAGIQRLNINDFDLAAITNEVNDWKSHGKFASYDISQRHQGLAWICLENLAAADGSIMVFEIHKLGSKRLFRTKAFWVIQLFSALYLDGPVERHGCVLGKMLVSAIQAAHNDVGHGFVSVMDLTMATRGPL